MTKTGKIVKETGETIVGTGLGLLFGRPKEDKPKDES